MVETRFNDVVLTKSDILSDKDYDTKKAGIISQIVNAPIQVAYERGENYALRTKDGFKVVKASPKTKGVDGNSAINHELAHVLFNSFDERATKTIMKWADEWGDQKARAYHEYHEALNVLEDQRIESLWGKIYLGNVREFQRTRKNLGKDLEFVDHPNFVLLAERFFRDDMVEKSKYSFLKQYLHDVEFTDITGSITVLNKIKPYIDEKINDVIERQKQIDNYKEQAKEKMKGINNQSENSKYEIDMMRNELDAIENELKKLGSEQIKETKAIDEKGRSDEWRVRPDTIPEDVKAYTDEELGTDYEESIKALRDKAESTVQVIRSAIESATIPRGTSRVSERPLSKRFTPDRVQVNNRAVKEIKRILKSFKEKPREAIVEDGYDLDIGEYINMKAKGHGECFIDEKNTHGLSVVISIDGSGSMSSMNKMVKEIASTLWKAVEDEKSIQIKCITWTSDNKGDFYIRRYNNVNDVEYLDQQGGGYTPTHFGIEQGSKELQKMSGKRKLLIVITDGVPMYKKNGVRIRHDVVVRETIVAYKKALKVTPNITVIGVGYIGYNDPMINMFQKRYVRCKSMKDVGQFMTSKMKKEIVRCMKN